MNHDQLGDLFSPIDGSPFHEDFDEMFEEAQKKNDLLANQQQQQHQQQQHQLNGQNQQPPFEDSQAYRPIAFRQEDTGNLPAWTRKNKILPGLSGFITLEDLRRGFIGEDDMRISGLDKIDIDNLIEQDPNLNLNQFFDGYESKSQHPSLLRQLSGNSTELNRQLSQGLSGLDIHHQQNDVGQTQDQNQQGNNNNNDSKEKMSFFRQFLPKLLDHHWDDVMKNTEGFEEFNQNFDVHGNIENILFLEENREKCGNHFESIFIFYAQELMNRFRTIVESTSFTPDLFIKILYENLCGLISDVFEFTKRCDGQFCFSLMKRNQTNKSKRLSYTHENIFGDQVKDNFSNAGTNSELDITARNLHDFIVPISKTENDPFNNNNIEENKRVEPSMYQANHGNLHSMDHHHNPFPMQNESGSNSNNTNSNFNFGGAENIHISDVESSAYSEKASGNKRYWQKKETDALEKLIQRYPHGIPMEKIQEFARHYDRTTRSIQSKVNKFKIQLRQKSRSSNIESSGGIFGDSVGENAFGEQSDSFDMHSASNNSRISNNRSEGGNIEQMICAAMSQMPDQSGTREQITRKIEELFANENKTMPDSLKNSIAQHLSSSNYFVKVKGTYGLKSASLAITNINEATSMKKRLQYILGLLPDNRADIETIRTRYWENFRNTIKQSQEETWERSLVKILSQYQEFDSSQSKMKYKLNSAMQTNQSYEQMWRNLAQMNEGQVC